MQPPPAEPFEIFERSPSLPSLRIRRFTRATSPVDFDRAFALRTEVFVDEQNVPPEEEQDDLDDEAVHWLIFGAVQEGETELPLATGRMLAYQEACQTRPVAKIGRIAVKRSERGRKLGERVMREILAFARAEGFEQAILDAQTSALGFYEKLGFVAEGEEFMDAGIPHYRMRLLLGH